jgi:eukaryotic-like serine/threonine-protein kinase
MANFVDPTLLGKRKRSVDDTFVPEGAVVGRHYTLHAKIGIGGMASVYLGWLTGAADFSRVVAIKRMHPQYALDEQFAERFRDEARLTARLSHPHIVQVFDVVERSKELLIVMEFVHGVPLGALAGDTRQAGRRIPPSVVAGVLVPALHGLHTAHQATDEAGRPIGIVHRDFSPQNIMVTSEGHAKILDFGIAKAKTHVHVTAIGEFSGKLGYCAPEQVCAGLLDRRTDVYAAGIVLWEMLAGERLFQAPGISDAEAVRRISHQPIPVPSSINREVPSRLDKVVLRALERDPDRRFASARELAFELEAAVDGASPSMVADWVERMCAERLAKLTHLLDSTRRCMAKARLVLPAAGAAPVQRAPITESVPEPVETSGVTGCEGTLRRVKTHWGWPIALAAVLIAVVAGGAFRKRLFAPFHRSLIVPEVSSARSARLAPEVVLVSSPADAQARIATAPQPSGMGAVASTVVQPKGPASGPKARAGRLRLRSTDARARPSTAKANLPGGRNCDPPTYIDSDGIRVFKDECL